MTITFGASGSAANGTTSLSVGYPSGIAQNDLLILTVVHKYPAASTPATPSGWTAPSNNSGTGGTGTGADSGEAAVTMFYRVADGTESGNVTVTITSGNSALGAIHRYRSTRPIVFWDVACTFGGDNTSDTTWSVTGAADQGVVGGDWVVAGSGSNTDTYSYSAEAITQTGITWGTNTERTDTGTTSGDDTRIVVSDHVASSGTSSAAPVFSMTASGSNANGPRGGTVMMRIRDNGPATEVNLTQGTVSALTQTSGDARMFQETVSALVQAAGDARLFQYELVVLVSEKAFPTTVAAVTSIGVPTITTGGGPTTVTPATVAAVAAIGAPGLLTPVAVATVVGAVTIGAPGILTPVAVVTVAATATIGSPVVTLGAQVAPATVNGSVAIGSVQVQVQVDAAPAPATVAGAATIGAPTVSTGAGGSVLRQVFEPEFTNKGWFDAVAAIEGWLDDDFAGSDVPAGSALVQAETVVGTVTIGSPTLPLVVFPATVLAVTTVGAVTVNAGAVVAPSTVAAVTTIGAPVTQSGAVVAATTVAGVASIGTAVTVAGAVVAATTVPGATAIGSVVVTVSTNATVTPATVDGTTVIGGTATISALITPATVDGTTEIAAPELIQHALVEPVTVDGSTQIALPLVLTYTSIVYQTPTGTTTGGGSNGGRADPAGASKIRRFDF